MYMWKEFFLLGAPGLSVRNFWSLKSLIRHKRDGMSLDMSTKVEIGEQRPMRGEWCEELRRLKECIRKLSEHKIQIRRMVKKRVWKQDQWINYDSDAWSDAKIQACQEIPRWLVDEEHPSNDRICHKWNDVGLIQKVSVVIFLSQMKSSNSFIIDDFCTDLYTGISVNASYTIATEKLFEVELKKDVKHS